MFKVDCETSYPNLFLSSIPCFKGSLRRERRQMTSSETEPRISRSRGERSITMPPLPFLRGFTCYNYYFSYLEITVLIIIVVNYIVIYIMHEYFIYCKYVHHGSWTIGFLESTNTKVGAAS